CAAVIALLANFLRAVFLVRIAATENPFEVSRWHNIAGYSIVLFVFVSTMALAYLLGKFEIRSPKSEIKRERSHSAFGTPASAIPWVIWAVPSGGVCSGKLGTATWYRRHERNLVSGIRWSVHWPQQAANFRKLKIDNEIRAVLRFDEGDAAGWTISSPV